MPRDRPRRHGTPRAAGDPAPRHGRLRHPDPGRSRRRAAAARSRAPRSTSRSSGSSRRGWSTSRLGESTPERGGRAKRFFKLKPSGLKALRESREMFLGLWRDYEVGAGSRMNAIEMMTFPRRAFVARLIPAADREAILGDLLEDSRRTAISSGARLHVVAGRRVRRDRRGPVARPRARLVRRPAGARGRRRSRDRRPPRLPRRPRCRRDPPRADLLRLDRNDRARRRAARRQLAVSGRADRRLRSRHAATSVTAHQLVLVICVASCSRAPQLAQLCDSPPRSPQARRGRRASASRSAARRAAASRGARCRAPARGDRPT